MIFVFIFLCVGNVQPVMAADTKNVTGICDYDQAYEVLKIVNQKRKSAGVQELIMDQDLLNVAMMRAAECVVSFDHVRPNGSSCLSIDKISGENIAMGYRSPEYVMNAWMNSSGHKKNIMNANYKSIGIGCLYQNGKYYWVQSFSYEKAVCASKPKNVKRTYQVSLEGGKDTVVVSEKTTGETEESEDTKNDTSKDQNEENKNDQNKQENNVENNPGNTPSNDGGTETTDSSKNNAKKKLKVKKFRAVSGNKKLTLKWKKTKKADGYQIQISNKKNFKKKQTYTVGKNKTKKTITKFKGKRLKSNKKYYVRIRAYKKVKNDNGKIVKQYGAWKKIAKKTR